MGSFVWFYMPLGWRIPVHNALYWQRWMPYTNNVWCLTFMQSCTLLNGMLHSPLSSSHNVIKHFLWSWPVLPAQFQIFFSRKHITCLKGKLAHGGFKQIFCAPVSGQQFLCLVIQHRSRAPRHKAVKACNRWESSAGEYVQKFWCISGRRTKS